MVRWAKITNWLIGNEAIRQLLSSLIFLVRAPKETQSYQIYQLKRGLARNDTKFSRIVCCGFDDVPLLSVLHNLWRNIRLKYTEKSKTALINATVSWTIKPLVRHSLQHKNIILWGRSRKTPQRIGRDQRIWWKATKRCNGQIETLLEKTIFSSLYWGLVLQVMNMMNARKNSDSNSVRHFCPLNIFFIFSESLANSSWLYAASSVLTHATTVLNT